MLSTPHLLAGAAIGSTVGGTPEAFLFGFLSHLLLDIIPHADDDLLDEPYKKRIMPSDYVFVTLDIIIGLAFVVYFAFDGTHVSQNVMAGAFGGVSPDILSNVPFWSPYVVMIPGFKQIDQLHKFVGFKNNGKRKLFGVLTQFVVIIISVLILVRNT